MRSLSTSRAFLVLGVIVAAAALTWKVRSNARPAATTLPDGASLATAFDAVTLGDLSDGSIAEPGAGGERIGFRITATYDNQKPSKAPPFHVSGSEGWTFFDATTSDGVPFGFGFEKPNPSASPFAFGKVMLTAPDGATGKRLVATFARVFHGKIPAERTATPIEPKPTSAAFLAIDAQKSQGGGGFAGAGGGWYATKLFLQKSGIEAEVFFNFSLHDRTGEFSEKDPDYADGMVAFLADELRDGPRPKRTPATDPSLSAKGPTITWTRTLPGKPYGMSRERDRFLVVLPGEGGASRLVATPFDRDEQTELLAVPHHLGLVKCSGELCLAVDQQPKEANTMSSEDPETLLLFDRQKKAPLTIEGAWGQHPSLPTEAWAPDGSFFVVGAYQPTGVGKASYQVLYLVGTEGKPRGPVDLGPDPIEVVSIAKTRILVRAGRRFGKEAKTSWLAVDPATLRVSPAAAPPSGTVASDDGLRLSPDQKRSVTCRKEGAEIVVKELPSGPERVFAVHADDRADIAAECVSWAGPKRLEYRSNVRGWLNVDTMKIGGTLDEDVRGLEYDRSFTWVVENGPKSARIGRITSE